MKIYDYKCYSCGFVRGEMRYDQEEINTARNDCVLCEKPMYRIINLEDYSRSYVRKEQLFNQ